MNQLVCEMCGGADLIKADGVFVCQSCGCKYSVEEARKMMGLEGVTSQGNVGARKNSQAENILKNADSTYEDGNYKEAFNLYSQALNIDPDNPHAIVFRALSSAWQSSVKDCRIMEINSAAKRALKLKHDQVGDTKEYFMFAEKVMGKASFVINGIANMYISYYNKATPTNYGITGSYATAGIAAEVKKTLTDGTITCCYVSEWLTDYALNGVASYIESHDGFWRNAEIMLKNTVTYRRNAGLGADLTMKGKITELNRKRQIAKDIVEKKRQEEEAKRREEEAREQAARNEAYWTEHAEEKKALESEKAELETKIQAMQSQVDEINAKRNAETDRLRQERDKKIPEQIECDKQIGVINELEHQKASLGLFKGKEKKEIQERIDQEVRKLEDLRKVAQDAVEKYKADINKQIQDVLNYKKDVTDEYVSMRKRQEDIETELKRNR